MESATGPARVALESRFAELGTFLLDSGHSVTDTRETLEAVQATQAPEADFSFVVLPETVFVGENAGAAPASMGTSGAPLSMTQSASANRLARALRLGNIGLDAAAPEGPRGAPRSAEVSVASPRAWWRSAFSGARNIVSMPVVGRRVLRRDGCGCGCADFICVEDQHS